VIHALADVEQAGVTVAERAIGQRVPRGGVPGGLAQRVLAELAQGVVL
jgi:hypothetical protein